MDYQEFKKKAVGYFEKNLPENAAVILGQTHKNNRAGQDYLAVSMPGNASPMIYLKPFYDRLCEGEAPEQVLENMRHFYEQAKGEYEPDIHVLKDPEAAGKHLVCRMIGADANSLMLSDLPHVKILDLAVTFALLLEHGGGRCTSVPVTYNMIKEWNMTTQQLYAGARDNTARLLPWTLTPMHELLSRMTGLSVCDDTDASPREGALMYVLSNTESCYGAWWMTDPVLLRALFLWFKKDFYILPSSVHECILLPFSGELNPEEMKVMVREINQTVLSPEDVLTDSVYSYDGERMSLDFV